MSSRLTNFLGYIKDLVPKIETQLFAFTGIGEVQNLHFGKNVNNYNTHIHFGTIGKQNKPLAIFTQRNLDTNVDTSVAFIPQKSSNSEIGKTGGQFNLNIHNNMPFGSGFHIIINQADWWKKEGSPNDKSILIDYIKLIPISVSTRVTYITTIERQNTFGFLIDSNQETFVEIFRGSELIKIDSINKDNPDFSFKEYHVNDILRFDNFPELLISLEKNIVEKVIIGEYTPRNSPKEYFVFILATGEN
jgi:hypothetical protein